VAEAQPYGVSCKGGLNTNLNQFEMLGQPGLATKLRNFEVDPDGGYRRINGYTQFGDGTRPNSSNDIFGLEVYADGLIACSGTNIYFSQDGDSWLQINKASVASGGDDYTAFTGRSAAARTSQDLATFAIYEGDTDYGEVIITDEGSGIKPMYFKMTGTGSALSSRTYFCKEITVSGTEYPKFCVMHDKHLVVAGAATSPNTIYYSGTSDIDDFTSTGSGSIKLDDQVVGIKSFRDDLIIFCANSIYKLQNINNSSTIAVVPITKNVGCLDGRSIQEIAGDLIFLSPDGIRTIAGTARIGDVELGSVSRQIQSIISDIASAINTFRIDSAVLRKKSQYRLFYSGAGSSHTTARGIIGTLTPNGFEWSETLGIQAHAIASSFDKDRIEKTYHGDKDGYIYVHDDGDYFTPAGSASNIVAEYTTPNLDFGDLGTRKTLQYARLSLSPEGLVQPSLRVRFDYEDRNIPQPPDYALTAISLPAIFGSSSSTFNSVVFGAQNDPMVRQAVQGSGHTSSFKTFSDDQKAPYTINGFYIDYVPAGRR
tara:strand:- start:1001 stop:2620 length:1620 start_codon:yes stop_codon:yes gene_type:complete